MISMTLLFAMSSFSGVNEKSVRWDFEDQTVGKPPSGWTTARTGEGEGSVWKIVEDASAPKGSKVLAQTAEGPSPLFNVCVAEETRLQDIEASVGFKAVEGKIDQGGGIVWHYADANNYYVARMNPLEKNFRVYKVVAGKRTQLGTASVDAAAGRWHTLTVRMNGDQIECHLNGKKHLEAKDDTFKAGKVGLWTKADAQTYFDNFVVQDLSK